MPRFEFRLQALLALRSNQRDQHRAALATILVAERALADERAALEADFGRQRAENRLRMSSDSLNVEQLRAAGAGAASARAHLDAIVERQRAVAVEVAARRDALADVERDVRGLEKLRERQHDEFRLAQARADARQMDEFASRAKHARA